MNVSLPSRCGWVLAIFAALLASPATGAESFAEHASTILLDAWRPSPQALPAAQAAHAKAIASDADDHRADYALALAQMKAAKWDLATASLASATRKNPQDLYAWRAHLWLLLYQRQFTAALAEIDRLAQTFPKAADPAAQAEPRWLAAAKIMGRAYGYIEGPRSGAMSADDLAAREAKLTAKFTPDLQQAFADGRAEVASAHAAALAAIDAEKQSVVDLKEDEKTAQREFVDSERSRIATESESLQQQAESAKGQLDADVNIIDQELTPIQQRYSDVQFSAQPYIQRIAELDRRLQFALSEANRNDAGDGKDQERVQRDRQRRDRARRDADALGFDIRREQEFLRPFQIESQQLQAAAAQLQQRRAVAVASYQRTIDSLNAALRKLQRIEKQLRISERELGKPTGSTSAKTSDLKARLPLLTTYEKFPLEQERQRLLKELSK